MNTQKRVDLDNPTTYSPLDRDGMLRKIKEFPSLCQQAWDLAMQFDLPKDFIDFDKVVVLGMGGSAIGGDLVSSIALMGSHVPIMVSRGYDLPGYVDKHTLVIANSYSGNTEETLTCYEQSLKTDARKLAITTGGKLKQIALGNGTPVFLYDYKSPPRAALPYSFMPLLCFLTKLRILDERNFNIKEMILALQTQQEQISEDIPLGKNEAKKLAADLQGHLAVIYGAETLTEVAHRWKTQINENSKAWAFYETFPELNHNSVVGYEFPTILTKNIFVVMLVSSFFNSRVQLRYDIVSRMLETAKINFRTAHSYGNNRLNEMMSLVLLGDYVSYYLALLNETDPTPVRTIDHLKEELAGK
jgi:glucose/mannose-6-phosphate isomerase